MSAPIKKQKTYFDPNPEFDSDTVPVPGSDTNSVSDSDLETDPIFVIRSDRSSKKREKKRERETDWNPGNCLKLILNPDSEPQIMSKSSAIKHQLGFVVGNMFKLIGFTNSTKNIVIIDPVSLSSTHANTHDTDSQNLRSPADSKDPYYTSLEEDGDDDDKDDKDEDHDKEDDDDDDDDDKYEDDDEDDRIFYLHSKYFEKVNCNPPFNVISTTPRTAHQKILTNSADMSQKAVSDNKYYIISTSVDKLNETNTNPHFYGDIEKIMSKNNTTPLFKFEIVKIIREYPNKTYDVVSIEDPNILYTVNGDSLTLFTSMADQDYIRKSNKKLQVRVVSTDIDIQGNVIIRPVGSNIYETINPENLIAIKGSNPRSEQSNFYPDDELDEPIFDIAYVRSRQNNDIKINCSFNKEKYQNSITNKNMRNFFKTDNCFIQYMIEPSDDPKHTLPDIINIDKFMSSGEAKGAGNDLFCNFICFISTEYPNIKYIKLVAQPRRNSEPTDAKRTILQIMLNDYYRSYNFFKIDQDNEFLACMSDLILSCRLPYTTVSFKAEADADEADADEADADDQAEDRGGSKRKTKKRKTKKQKTKKRIRRKSIKKNNFFEKKRKRRKSKKKKK